MRAPDERLSRSDLQERLILRSWEDEEFRIALLRNPYSVISQELTAMSGRRSRNSPRHLRSISTKRREVKCTLYWLVDAMTCWKMAGQC